MRVFAGLVARALSAQTQLRVLLLLLRLTALEAEFGVIYCARGRGAVNFEGEAFPVHRHAVAAAARSVDVRSGRLGLLLRVDACSVAVLTHGVRPLRVLVVSLVDLLLSGSAVSGAAVQLGGDPQLLGNQLHLAFPNEAEFRVDLGQLLASQLLSLRLEVELLGVALLAEEGKQHDRLDHVEEVRAVLRILVPHAGHEERARHLPLHRVRGRLV